MLDNYEINLGTLAIIPLSENTSKIIEEDNIYIVNKNSTEIVDHSCKYFGSSYIGRNDGSKEILGYSYKLPIVVDEMRDLIFIPTCSPRLEKCYWISLKHIKNFTKNNTQTNILFDNNNSIISNISYRSFENQILRATFLENELRKRRK